MQTRINQIVYMAIESDYSYNFFETFDDAFKYSPQGIIAKIKHTKTHTSYKGYDHEIYNVDFLDENQRTKQIIRRGWKIVSIGKGLWSSDNVMDIELFDNVNTWSSMNECIYADPTGIIKPIKFSMYLSDRKIFGPIQFIKYLDEISKYRSWEEFELKLENKSLLKKIDELEYAIESITDENEKLKEEIKNRN